MAKKIALGGEGGWDYFTTDPATHKILIARGSYVMVLDPDGKITAKMDVGKDNEAHASRSHLTFIVPSRAMVVEVQSLFLIPRV